MLNFISNITVKSLFVKINILLTMFIFSSCSDSSDDEEMTIIDSKPKIGIILAQNTSVRLQPFIYSAKVAQLRRNTKVKIVEQSKEKSKIAGKRNYWYKIEVKKGLYGWTYGTNIRIFSEDDTSSIESLEHKMRENDIKNMLKKLKGKWWSINRWGEFTNHSIAFWDDFKYRSIRKGRDKDKKGTFKIDLKLSKIELSDGSFLGKEFKFFERGSEIGILYKGKKYTTKFKKISTDPEDKFNE